MAIKKTTKAIEPAPTVEWPFGRRNYLLFGISLAIIIVGYICLGYGDDPNDPVTLTLAPILLVIGYAMIPFAIMAKDRSRKAASSETAAKTDSEQSAAS